MSNLQRDLLAQKKNVPTTRMDRRTPVALARLSRHHLEKYLRRPPQGGVWQ